MTLARWYNRSALSLVVLAIIAYSVAAVMPEFAVLAAPVILALWKLSRRKPGPGVGARFLLPRLVVNVTLFAVLAYALVRSQSGLQVETIAQVVVLIQIIKIGDRRAPRDDAQILCLAVFLAIAAMLDSNSVWTGVLLALFLPLLITTVMLFQLHQGAVQAAEAGGTALDAPAAPYRRGLRATSAVATIGTMALALVVFILMPRGIGENVFGSIGTPRQSRIQGFTASVTLGSKGILSTSSKVVLDMTVKDSTGQNIGSPETVHYLRGAVLTDYQNSKWTANEDRRNVMEEPYTAVGKRSVAMRSGTVIEQSISMRSAAPRTQWQHLFALWAPTDITFTGSGRFKFSNATYVLQRMPESGSLDYTVWSVPHELAPRTAQAGDRPRVTIESERIRDLAVSILEKAGVDPDPETRAFDDDTQGARAIQEYLRANMTYTLELVSPPRDVDPVEHFLFTRKKGHCEYLASAMVLLCRGVGINARMVTGYVATEFSTATGTYTVRESNAHAWVEVEDAGRRWRRFDPTAPADLERIHRVSPGLFGKLRQALEAMEYAWNSSIVAFNEQTRQSLLGPSRVSRRVQRGGVPLMVSALATGTLVFLGAMIVGFAAQALAGLVRRTRPGSVSTVEGVLPSRTPYHRMLRLLARRKLAKPRWMPPLEHAAALAQVNTDLAADVRVIADAYYAERFGGSHGLPRSQVRRAMDRIRRFRPHGR